MIDQDVISLDKNPFRAERIMVRLDGGVVLYHQTSHRLKTHTKIDSDLMAFLVIGPGADGTIDGMTMHPDQLIAVAPGGEANLVVGAGYSSITLLIPPVDVTTQIAVRELGPTFQIPRGVDANAASGPSVSNFYRLGRDLIAVAARRPNIFNSSRAVRIAGQVELLEHLLTILRSPTEISEGRDARDRTRVNYSQIIRKAEEFALAHVADRVLVSDLCRVAGVSERTLQQAFQEMLRITPIAYLNRVRLHRARASLRDASPTKTTVSAVAMDWGFWHFGEFSKAYKACFHERPSQTLRRKSRE